MCTVHGAAPFRTARVSACVTYGCNLVACMCSKRRATHVTQRSCKRNNKVYVYHALFFSHQKKNNVLTIAAAPRGTAQAQACIVSTLYIYIHACCCGETAVSCDTERLATNKRAAAPDVNLKADCCAVLTAAVAHPIQKGGALIYFNAIRACARASLS